MSFEIRATEIGPVIVHGEKFITLVSEDALIEFCHEDGTRLGAIEDHIREELRETADSYIEGFAIGINPPAGKLYAYIAAYQQFWMFKNIRFAQYVQAVLEAEAE